MLNSYRWIVQGSRDPLQNMTAAVTADKWIGSYGRRVRTKIAHPSLSAYSSTNTKFIDTLQWDMPGTLPVRSGRVTKPLRPRYANDDYAFSQPEYASIDKWLWSTGKESPAYKQPTRPRTDIDAYQLTLPEVSSLDKWISSVGMRLIKPRQPLRDRFSADTLTTPGAQPDIVLDRWNWSTARTPAARRPIRSRIVGVGKSAEIETVTLDKFLESVARGHSPRHPTRPQFAIDAYQLTQPGVTSTDFWFGSFGRQVLAARRVVHNYEVGAAGVEERINLDKWWSRNDSTPKRKQLIRVYNSTDLRLLDLLLPQWNVPSTAIGRVLRQPTRTRFSSDTLTTPGAQPDVVLDRWIWSTAKQTPAARQPYRQRFSTDDFHLMDVGFVQPDWLPAYRDFSRAARHPIRIYNSTDLKLLELTLSQWESSTSIGCTYRQPVRPRFTIDSLSLTQAEFMGIDKWLASSGRRMRAGSQPSRPWGTADAKTPDEIITLDKFSNDYIEFARRRRISGKSGFDIDAEQLMQPAAPETLTMDKWWNDHLVLPWRAIDKFSTRRNWLIVPTRIVISLPDVIKSSTKPVVKTKTTEPVVANKTTRGVISSKTGIPVIGVKTTKPVIDNKTTFKP